MNIYATKFAIFIYYYFIGSSPQHYYNLFIITSEVFLISSAFNLSDRKVPNHVCLDANVQREIHVTKDRVSIQSRGFLVVKSILDNYDDELEIFWILNSIALTRSIR